MNSFIDAVIVFRRPPYQRKKPYAKCVDDRHISQYLSFSPITIAERMQWKIISFIKKPGCFSLKKKPMVRGVFFNWDVLHQFLYRLVLFFARNCVLLLGFWVGLFVLLWVFLSFSSSRVFLLPTLVIRSGCHTVYFVCLLLLQKKREKNLFSNSSIYVRMQEVSCFMWIFLPLA